MSINNKQKQKKQVMRKQLTEEQKQEEIKILETIAKIKILLLELNKTSELNAKGNNTTVDINITIEI